jgi:hypothetical protein
MWVGGERHAPAALTTEKRPGTHCTGGLVGLRASLDGSEKISSPGVRTPDRPARSKSLYRLRYPGPYHTAVHRITTFSSHNNFCGWYRPLNNLRGKNGISRGSVSLWKILVSYQCVFKTKHSRRNLIKQFFLFAGFISYGNNSIYLYM